MLSHVIAIRGEAGGDGSAERPFVIEHREALIYMLCEAAEIEHALMCEYLFAAFSLKQRVEEGLTPEQLASVERWRSVMYQVAAQEMLHLALVQNLLTAIGASPHLSRPNLPHPARHFPPGVQVALMPFGERALRHFLYLERPEGMALDDAEGFAAVGEAVALMEEGDVVPRLQDFATVGHLYRSIEAGLGHLVQKYGEARLFVGPPEAQATAATFGWPELIPVTDLSSAVAAIETIVEQGEGARGEWREAHFGRFLQVLDDYLALKEAAPSFEPARPVLAAKVRPPEIGADTPLIGDPITARVADLFNVGYEVLLQLLYRFFAHTDETDQQLATLADVAVGLMLEVLMPLGLSISTLPVGPAHPELTAGATFELLYETDYLLPHRRAAWLLIEERLGEAAAFGRRIMAQPEAPSLDGVVAALARFAQMMADAA